ncbi:hypothetical protein [Streptomyces sp. IBSBF 2394]|uniref:hypothetical protein n=1 Tax=Streptomyces sp. IBSBF 2394 TaxID=2903532 RepID=UPI002FDBE0A5
MPSYESDGGYLLPEHIEEAVKMYCNAPDFDGLLPDQDQQVDITPEGQENPMLVPLGAVIEKMIEAEDGVSARLIPESLIDVFDYHGMRLSEFSENSERLYMELNSTPRPTGWEHKFIHELDARFSADPDLRLGPEAFHSANRPDLPFEQRLTQLAGTGLRPGNWERMPHLRAAFERHQIPIKFEDGGYCVDEAAYKARLRQRDIAAVAAATLPDHHSNSARHSGSDTAPAHQLSGTRRRADSPLPEARPPQRSRFSR